MNGVPGHPEKLDLARDLLNELIAQVFGGSERRAHSLTKPDIVVASWRA